MSEAAETLAVAKKLQPMLAELVTKVRALSPMPRPTSNASTHHRHHHHRQPLAMRHRLAMRRCRH